jgi:hypothetical protein
MLWRFFTVIRDLLLCFRDLLFGDRPDDIADMPPRSPASGASAPGSSSSQPSQVQGGDHVTFDQLHHYHQSEVSGRITNIHEELANIRSDSAELKGRLTSHAQGISVLTRQHADFVDETLHLLEVDMPFDLILGMDCLHQHQAVFILPRIRSGEILSRVQNLHNTG